MGFIGSTSFIVATAVGIVLAGGFLAIPTLFPEWVESIENACDAPETADFLTNGEERVVASAPRLDVCVSVGSINIQTHQEDYVHVELHVDGDVELGIVQEGETLRVAQGRTERAAWWLGGDDPEVHVRILVPETAMTFHAVIDVGEIAAQGLNGTGTHGWSADVGDINLDYANIQGGMIRATSDVGDVTVHIPSATEVDLRGATDVGSVEYAFPNMVILEKDDDPAGDALHAQTRGYPDATVRTHIVLATDVGNVMLRATLDGLDGPMLGPDR